MDTSKRTARIAGVFYIIGTVTGVLSVIFTGPVHSAPDYLTGFSTNETQVILGSLCVLAMGLALAMVPVVIYPVLREHDETLALGYVVFRGALETFTYLATVMSWLYLVVLSRTPAQAGTWDASSFQALGTLFVGGEVMSFITTVVFILGALMFYYLLYRSRLVPRWLSGWGLLSTAPYIVAGFLVIFGVVGHMSTVDTVFRLPLALQEMALAAWLIVKGLNSSETKIARIEKQGR
jgi:hypothetical protein